MASKDTLILELKNSRFGQFLCGHDVMPVRYQAAISPLPAGSRYVRVTYQNLSEKPVILGAAVARVLPDH
jgi:hypothetical protein